VIRWNHHSITRSIILQTLVWNGPPEHPVALIGVGLVTPGEEFSCDNDLADQLIEQKRATLVDDNGRTHEDAADDGSTEINPTQHLGVLTSDLPGDSATVAPATQFEDTPENKAAAAAGKKNKAALTAETTVDAAALASAESEVSSAPTTGAVVTGTKTKATLEAEVAADEAALATAQSELASPPAPESV